MTPIRDECFVAQRGRGSWLNGLSMGTAVPVHLPLERTIAVVDFKRLDRHWPQSSGAEPPYGRNAISAPRTRLVLGSRKGVSMCICTAARSCGITAAASLYSPKPGGQAVTLDGEEVFTSGLGSRSVVATRDPELFQAWKHGSQPTARQLAAD